MILVWDAVLDLIYAGTPYLLLLYNLFIYMLMPILSQVAGGSMGGGMGLSGAGVGLGVGGMSPGNYSDRIQGPYQPINTSKYPINTSKQPINTSSHVSLQLLRSYSRSINNLLTL